MQENWPTEKKDLRTARLIMEEYAGQFNVKELGLLEIIFNESEKRMDYRLSGWVVMLANHFSSLYGPTKGNYITRQIVTRYITRGETVH